MKMKQTVILGLCLLLFSSCAVVGAKKGLVVLDRLQIRNTHSLFFQNLEAKGYELDYFEASDPDLEITRHGEHLYDFLVLFTPETDEFGGRLDVDAILNFIDAGNDCLIAASGEVVSDPVREVALECGVEFGDDGTYVIDHLNFDATDFDGDHTLIVANDFIDIPIITGDKPAPVLFRGVDQFLEDNDLLYPILKASSTAYGYSPDESIDEPHSKGKGSVLISALQARNNARVLFSGSLEFFSDEFMKGNVQIFGSAGKPQKSGNLEFVDNVIGWLFKERGLIRADNIKHSLEGGDVPAVYTVKQKLQYQIDISEWNGKAWVPYSGKDVQLEFVMLDPYVRTFLENDGTSSTFSKVIHIPDVYGIFTLRIKYNRPGYSTIDTETLVTVRPFRHNEFERFIVAAYPYLSLIHISEPTRPY
eukprot:TRINITY_DN2162_c0_g1_i4.p1 TRINITY_DN2162_c0_g1~~TRINITY_DN2162_c0_g1_i4.p1  ORF type:complete len:419 (+),score=73.63 TRINITY_DN2162_c0_g1_i4:51-1307(+)